MSEHVDYPASIAAPPPTLLTYAQIALLLGVPSLTPAQEQAAQVATSALQTYLDRGLIFGTYTETHLGGVLGTLQLLNYPVKQIDSLAYANGGGSLTPFEGYTLVRPTGVVLNVPACEVTVTYQGGFEVIPPDLQAAFMATFATVEASAGSGYLGAVRKVSVTGVGAVEYDQGGGDSGGGIGSPWGLIPATAVALLAPYRNHGPVGVG